MGSQTLLSLQAPFCGSASALKSTVSGNAARGRARLAVAAQAAGQQEGECQGV